MTDVNDRLPTEDRECPCRDELGQKTDRSREYGHSTWRAADDPAVLVDAFANGGIVHDYDNDCVTRLLKYDDRADHLSYQYEHNATAISYQTRQFRYTTPPFVPITEDEEEEALASIKAAFEAMQNPDH